MRKLLLLLFVCLGLRAQTPAAYPGAYSLDNDTSTGTTFQKLVKLSAGKAVISGTSPTDPIGICVSNCGTSGPAVIAWSGTVGCVFDNTAVADHWAIPSTSVSGDCSDNGSTIKPISGPVVGQIKTISGGGAGTVSYVLMALIQNTDVPLAFTTQTDGATITWAIGSARFANATVTLGGNRTLNITNPVNGGSYVLKVVQDATGTRGLTLGTGCTWKVSGGGSGAITPSTAANAIDILAFTYDGTNCYANFNKNFN